MPITPHVAEELWSIAGFHGLVSAAQFPEAREISSNTEYNEDFIRGVMSDIAQIRKVANIEPKNIVIYTSPAWKVEVMTFALEMMKDGNLDIPSLTKRCMADENMRKNGKAVSEFAKKTATEFIRSTVDAKRPIVELDETAFLRSCEGFLSTELGTSVKVYSADQEELYDPQNKSKVAVPGRPAILLE